MFDDCCVLLEIILDNCIPPQPPLPPEVFSSPEQCGLPDHFLSRPVLDHCIPGLDLQMLEQDPLLGIELSIPSHSLSSHGGLS